MKKLSSISLYVLGLVLVLASGLMLAYPPTTALAAACVGSCQYGSSISVSGDSCSCTDNVGCTYTKNGQSYKQDCAKKTGDEEILLEEALAN
ncbi:MAG TPA: hypothetical protein VF527_10565 [Pyrinomonadaceae bacterium]|jgi:hypothetical protein